MGESERVDLGTTEGRVVWQVSSKITTVYFVVKPKIATSAVVSGSVEKIGATGRL